MKAIVCTRYGKTEDVVELLEMPTPMVQAKDVFQANAPQIFDDCFNLLLS